MGCLEARNALNRSPAEPQARYTQDSARDNDATIDGARRAGGTAIPTRSAASTAELEAASRPKAGRPHQPPIPDLRGYRAIRMRRFPAEDNPDRQRRWKRLSSGSAVGEQFFHQLLASGTLRARCPRC